MTLVALVEKATRQFSASLAVTLSAIITYVFYKSWLYPYHLDPLSKIQGPSPSRIPFLGNMLALTKKKPMMTLFDWAMEYPGLIYRYYWFTRLTLMTSDPVTVGYVLGKGNDNWVKSKETEEMFEQNLGHSLLSMKGHEHTPHRKYLAKGFKHTYLKSMATAFHGVAQDLLGVWRERLVERKNAQDDDKAEKEVTWEHDGKTYTTIDLEPSFYCLTLDSIGQFALGQGFDAIKTPIGPDFDNYKTIVDSFQVTLLTMLPLSNWIPTKTNRRAWSAAREFNSSMEGIVQERKQILLDEIKANDGEFSQEEGAISQKKDMLTMLLVDQLIGEGGTDLQIRHDVFSAIFAGHETTSAALSWTFYQLACHPEIQSRVREETRQLYKDRDGAPSYDELNSLPYLNAVIRESLRLWSPVPLNLRVSVDDDHLPRSNGLKPLFVPAKTNLQIPMFILQRDPKIWGPDSLEFKPERWLISEKACPPYMPPNGLCYFPFYHGKRSCVGNKIATLEMKTHIANLINTFEFIQTPELRANQGEIDWRWSISLKPSPGVSLGVRLAN
ncbi:MAG: cytochrome P450 [Linnemannia gamsii]|nr:MAG: cytochrome P450 [Linnemannia gamsii]